MRRKVYLISLAVIAAASAYPLYMGVVMAAALIRDGGITAADYPSYVIPYSPLCLALIISVAAMPGFVKLWKNSALPVASAVGAGLFLFFEIMIEKIAVFANGSVGAAGKITVETWQLFSCVVTPQVRDAVWDSLSIRYNPSFKLHFYAIALLILLSVLGVVYGFYRMAEKGEFSRKRPLITQLVCVTVFVALCITACLTAFYRTGDINVSAVSAVLMTLFFLTFGVTGGVYAGTLLYEKKRGLSVFLPSLIAMVVTILMYIGEMVMMNKQLYRFGTGFLFEPMGPVVLSPVDALIVVLSGVVTYLILFCIRKKGANR